jgi:sigma-B regulation protein RsbU (phosphoserine phosphatase)
MLDAAGSTDVETRIGEDRVKEIAARLRRAEQEIESLSSEILDRYEEATLIYRLAERLGSVLGEQAISRQVLEDAARVLGARAGEIWLTNDSGVALAAATPAGQAIPAVRDDEGALAALGENRPWTRDAGAAVEPMVAVPLPSPNSDPIGVLVLRGRSGERSYLSGEVKLLTTLAALSAAFIRNHRLSEQAQRAAARLRETEIAREIHRSLLPAEDPAFPGLEIAASCIAAEAIGGDFYGFIEMPDGSMGVAMADVSGHGVGAALYMAAAKGALQAEARRVFSPGDLLRRVNEALTDDFSRSDVFATTFFARFYPGGSRFSFSSGGHNPALLIRANGNVERLGPAGPALGVLPAVNYEEDIRRFAEGDLLIVYTDGLVEARDPQQRFYGIDRLARVAVQCRRDNAVRIKARLLADLDDHCGTQLQRDDVTLLVVRAVPDRGRAIHGQAQA